MTLTQREVLQTAIVTGAGVGILVLVGYLTYGAPYDLTGPLMTTTLLVPVILVLRWSNAATRIRHERDSELPAPHQAPTPSWQPLMYLLVVIVPMQAALNSFWGHAGDVVVGVLVGLGLIYARWVKK